MEPLQQRALPFRLAQDSQYQEQQQQQQLPSPEFPPSAPSRSSTSSSTRSRKSNLSLDLSNLPGLTKPTPPCNTLIFTNLQSRDIFAADNLQTIRDLISQTAAIHAFSPLKSLSRIVVSFYSDADAIAVRQVWDGEAVLGERCRVYFGQPTPLVTSRADTHLALPDAGKLFFISPPPSPPHGWEQRLEDAPNKMVHADDLAEALAKLRHHHNASDASANGPMASPVSPVQVGPSGSGSGSGSARAGRSRSSTLVFQPNPQLGASPDLPCVVIHDMTDEPDEMSPSPVMEERPIMAHTARPPVELMHDA